MVGAGPGGNNAALGLARRNCSVTVIDWRHNLGDKLCTGIVGRECTSRFPIAPELVYRQAASARLVTPGDDHIAFATPTPQAAVVDRAAYVASFARQAQQAGAKYVLGQRVIKVIPEADSVAVVTDQGTHRARALIIAAGFGSPLTRQLGLGAVSDYVVGVQARVATHDVADVEVHLGSDVAPGFFSWLVPTLPGQALVGLLARRDAAAHLQTFLRRLQDEGKVTEVIQRPATWGVPLRPLKRTYRDRVLVVGDAAGQVKPVTGGGIFYSLLAAEIAAEVLAQALETNNLSAGSLERYEQRWKSLLSRELDVGYSARRLYEFLSDQQIDSLARQAGDRCTRNELINSPDFRFDWHGGLISRVMNHPLLGGMLRVVNPLLAHFALRTEPSIEHSCGQLLASSTAADALAGASESVR